MEEYKVQNESCRLDKYIAEKNSNYSRAIIQKMIIDEKVLVNGKKTKNSYKVTTGDVITIEDSEPKEDFKLKPQKINLDVIYEDDDIIIINKEKGMVVHPGNGNPDGTLANAILERCKDSLSGIGGVVRPGIVHRIDKDTTGVLVVAKNDKAHNFLSSQLQNHSMKREYIALVEGRLKEDTGTINKPIGRNKRDRLKMGIVDDGKRAVTHYEVLERYKNTTLIKCVLETGRTHQIRVHMASIGHPLVGDEVYGFKKQRFKLKGQVLHAKTLGFIHPKTKEYMEFTTDLPKYYNDLIEKLRKEV